jgi:hypothetical protein
MSNLGRTDRTTGFNPTFDFRTEAAEGEDPDKVSPTLKAFHKLLWSKPLPNGEPFNLNDDTPDAYLHAESGGREFFLSSDTCVPTWLQHWSQWTQGAQIRGELSALERDDFYTVMYQMGGMMLFPGRQVNRQWTLNQARGCTPEIMDRLDLTIECIRLFYEGDTSAPGNPLGPTIARYEDFFSLFDDFAGYVDFFLLHDLLTEDRSRVRFFHTFSGFRPYAFPTTVAEYRAYRDNAVQFIRLRNQRMVDSLEATR